MTTSDWVPRSSWCKSYAGASECGSMGPLRAFLAQRSAALQARTATTAETVDTDAVARHVAVDRRAEGREQRWARREPELSFQPPRAPARHDRSNQLHRSTPPARPKCRRYA